MVPFAGFFSCLLSTLNTPEKWLVPIPKNQGSLHVQPKNITPRETHLKWAKQVMQTKTKEHVLGVCICCECRVPRCPPGSRGFPGSNTFPLWRHAARRRCDTPCRDTRHALGSMGAGFDLCKIKQDPEIYLGSTWGLPGVYLGSTWGLPGVYLGSTWVFKLSK